MECLYLTGSAFSVAIAHAVSCLCTYVCMYQYLPPGLGRGGAPMSPLEVGDFARGVGHLLCKASSIGFDWKTLLVSINVVENK